MDEKVCEYGATGKPIIDCERYKQLQTELAAARKDAGYAGQLANDHRDVTISRTKQIKRLREALEKYGKHKQDCVYVRYSYNTKYPCTCGFEQALQENKDE